MADHVIQSRNITEEEAGRRTCGWRTQKLPTVQSTKQQVLSVSVLFEMSVPFDMSILFSSF